MSSLEFKKAEICVKRNAEKVEEDLNYLLYNLNGFPNDIDNPIEPLIYRNLEIKNYGESDIKLTIEYLSSFDINKYSATDILIKQL